jgi:hypothetical protein
MFLGKGLFNDMRPLKMMPCMSEIALPKCSIILNQFPKVEILQAPEDFCAELHL